MLTCMYWLEKMGRYIKIKHKIQCIPAIMLSGAIIRGTLKTPNSQLVTPISIKLQRPDGYD
jgi:hypothetical protein